MKNKTENELIQDLINGDASALQEIYYQFHPRIFSYLVRLSGDEDIAKDLSSEVWCRVSGKSGKLRRDSHLTSWLFTIARNLFISYYRWRKRDNHYLSEIGHINMNNKTEDSPLEIAYQSERELILENAITRLPSTYREVIILIGIEGLSYNQAANICGIREDAMRKRFSRAKKLLKEILLCSDNFPNKEV